MNESVKQLKEIFPKNDLKYYSSQISGTILGYTGALIASNLTDSIEINDSLETLINLGTKGSLYWLGNLGIYYLLNKDLDEKKLGENLKNLNNAIKSGFLTSYSLKGVSYLTILQIDSIPNNFAPLYAYPLAGMFGLFIKLKKSKETKLFNLPSLKQLKELKETSEIELGIKSQIFIWEKTRKLEKILNLN